MKSEDLKLQMMPTAYKNYCLLHHSLKAKIPIPGKSAYALTLMLSEFTTSLFLSLLLVLLVATNFLEHSFWYLGKSITIDKKVHYGWSETGLFYYIQLCIFLCN